MYTADGYLVVVVAIMPACGIALCTLGAEGHDTLQKILRKLSGEGGDRYKLILAPLGGTLHKYVSVLTWLF